VLLLQPRLAYVVWLTGRNNMVRNSELTDRQRRSLFGSGGGLGSFMYNYGPSGAPSNAPPTAFARGLLRDDPSNIGLNEIPPEQQQQPSDLEAGEDSPFQVVFESLFGEQGIPDNVDPKILRALQVANETQDASQLEAFKEEINAAGGYQQWLESQEEGTSVEDVVESVTEGVSNTVRDAVQAARDALPDSASIEDILDWIAENAPTVTPQSIFDEYIGAGVGVNLPTGAPIGSGTVFIPGIPGLPSSSPNMVIGTVDEVLGDILSGELPGILGDIAEDPLGGLGAAVQGAADDAEATLGDLLGADLSFDEEGQTTDYGGGLNTGEEQEDVFGGVGGGGTAPAATVARPTVPNDFTPFMRRLDYQPVALTRPILPQTPIVSGLFKEYLK